MKLTDFKNRYGVELANGNRLVYLRGVFYAKDFELCYSPYFWNVDLTQASHARHFEYLENGDIVRVFDLRNETAYKIKMFLEHEYEVMEDAVIWQHQEQKTGRVTLENVEDGDKYWFVNFAGVICHYVYIYHDTDIDIITKSPLGAWYTKEEAIKALEEAIKALEVVKRFVASEDFDKYLAGKEVVAIVAKYLKKHFPDMIGYLQHKIDTLYDRINYGEGAE